MWTQLVAALGPASTLLTHTRTVLAALVTALLVSGTAPSLAAVAYWAGAATDALDGPVARWLGRASLKGARMDLMADEELLTAPLIFLGYGHLVPWWTVAVLLISGLVVAYARFEQGKHFRMCVMGRTHVLVKTAAVGAGLTQAAGANVTGALPAPKGPVVPREVAQIVTHGALAPAALMLSAYLLLAYWTSRPRVVVDEATRDLPDDTRRLYVVWHGNPLLLIPHARGREIAVLAALNCSGAIGAMTAVAMGYAPLRLQLGNQRSVAAAAAKMVEWLRSGHDAVLFADGPFGPAREVKPLVVSIAGRTGAAVVPVAWSASISLNLRNRWDNAAIPLPFARSVIVYGPPATVREKLSAEQSEDVRATLTSNLIRTTEVAQRLLGRRYSECSQHPTC